MSATVVGALVGLGFAVGWAVAGVTGLSATWRPAAGAVSAAALVASATAVLVDRPAGGHGHFNGAVYAFAVLGEVAAILVVGWLLTRSGKSEFVPPVIAGIVGLHFLGLLAATGDAVFLAASVGLCAVALVAAMLAHLRGVHAGRAFAGLGSAAVLCLAALVTAFR